MNEDEQLGQQIASMSGKGLLVLIAIGVLAASFTMIPGCMDRQKAKAQCDKWVDRVLAEAKVEKPDPGTYNGDIPIQDPWHNNLRSTLFVEDLQNKVTVTSLGKDGEYGTSDDISSRGTDIHVRKSALAAVERTAHSAGKGLATGVVEGLGSAKDAVKEKAKSGYDKAKRGLMSRFKKQPKSEKGVENEGD